MTIIDSILQLWRIRTASKHLAGNLRLIDIGAHKGELFEYLGDRIIQGYGIEPTLDKPLTQNSYSIVPGSVPEIKPLEKNWDAITMLAVIEHIKKSYHNEIADYCYEHLKPGGIVVITVPIPSADKILNLLKWCRLIDGMSLEEHMQFLPEETFDIFKPPSFELVAREQFQLGYNQLFVFKKISR